MICSSQTVRLVSHCLTTRTSRTNDTVRAIIRVVSVRVYWTTLAQSGLCAGLKERDSLETMLERSFSAGELIVDFYLSNYHFAPFYKLKT